MSPKEITSLRIDHPDFEQAAPGAYPMARAAINNSRKAEDFLFLPAFIEVPGPK